jgi:hypothetical protein
MPESDALVRLEEPSEPPLHLNIVGLAYMAPAGSNAGGTTFMRPKGELVDGWITSGHFADPNCKYLTHWTMVL